MKFSAASPRLRVKLIGLALAFIGMMLVMAEAKAFDHTHARWDAVLKNVVVVSADGNQSAVRYRSLKADRSALDDVLMTFSVVSASEYASWSKPEQLAFLINTYNAFTIDLVLTRYPDLKSIKDIGGWFGSPWKKQFIPLLGRTISLDDLEHGIIRQPGTFDEPRIHVAVVCASVGCPMLRPEAYRADRLNEQLEDAMRRFLSDRTRNGFDASTNALYLSRIFDWYSGDFGSGDPNTSSALSYVFRYANALADTEADRQYIQSGRADVKFTAYDWSLNDVGRKHVN